MTQKFACNAPWSKAFGACSTTVLNKYSHKYACKCTEPDMCHALHIFISKKRNAISRNKILNRENEMLLREKEILIRLNKMLFRENEILNR